MRKINKPTITTATVLADCSSVIQNANLRARIRACSDLIINAEGEFEAKITQGQIYTIAQEDIVNGNVSADELKNVYTAQMVKNPTGRVHYDNLLNSAPLGRCPLCGHRDAKTLDHYLPKALYPRLSFVPINLIPACWECNKGKHFDFPTTDDEETLHPYYDDIENVQWLKMAVNQTNPVSVTYYVQRAAGWSDLLFSRVQKHFVSFEVARLYSVQAARELSGFKGKFQSIFNGSEGADGLRKALTIDANSWVLDNKNSWQSALYEGLANDDWFCNGGVLNI